jgi:hypothetical protein
VLFVCVCVCVNSHRGLLFVFVLCVCVCVCKLAWRLMAAKIKTNTYACVQGDISGGISHLGCNL